MNKIEDHKFESRNTNIEDELQGYTKEIEYKNITNALILLVDGTTKARKKYDVLLKIDVLSVVSFMRNPFFYRQRW